MWRSSRRSPGTSAEAGTRLRTKLLLSLMSLLVGLCALEISLRVLGYVYASERASAPARPAGLEAAHRILCVGDSFTFGGEGAAQSAYPVLLQRLIEERTGSWDVVTFNRGICESTSSTVVRNLPGWIRELRPTAVVVLVGSANAFSPWDHGGQAGLLRKVERFLLGFRVAKMARILYLNLKGRSGRGLLDAVARDEPDGPPGTERWGRAEDWVARMARIRTAPAGPGDSLEAMWTRYNTADSRGAVEMGERMLRTSPSPEVFASLVYMHLRWPGRDKARAGQVLRLALAASPRSELVRDMRAFYFGWLARDAEQDRSFGNAVARYLDAIEADPLETEAYYGLGKAFDLQSRYDAAAVVSRLERIRAASPASEHEILTMAIRLYQDRRAWQDEARAWLRRDLEEMARIARRENVRLIMAGYPVQYPLANDVLREVARSEGLPFVDNLSVFEKLSPARRYILDDDHCTAEGHRVLAENVLRVLAAQGVLPR